MKIFDLHQKYSSPIVVSLGFFDCIHTGHKSLIQTANKLASGVSESFIMTFSNDPSELFGKSKQIYDFNDRVEAISNLGADGIISAKFDENFANLTPRDFLDMLFENYDVKAVVVGADYTFGINAEGDVDYLKKYCDVHGVKTVVVPFECINGEKLSTRNLKSLVELGDVKALNAYLSEPYFVRGEVVGAKHNGTRMGFPTANIAWSDSRFKLGDGVYATKIQIDGKEFVSMTNVGAKPTFKDFTSSVETHVMDFSGDLYGKNVKLKFFDRIRDIKQFASVDELREQLTLDEQHVKRLFAKEL